MGERPREGYTLLDVRRPREYEKERIPGATLVPLPVAWENWTRTNRCSSIARWAVGAARRPNYSREKGSRRYTTSKEGSRPGS